MENTEIPGNEQEFARSASGADGTHVIRMGWKDSGR